MTRWLQSFALRIVPREWRDDVARDLDDEQPRAGAGVWFVVHVLAVGVRLHAARLADHLPSLHRSHASYRSAPMNGIVRDFKLAIRGAVRRPAYSLAVIATLAIGIGANTAIFSVFNWILFRPLPAVQRPTELVTIKFQTPKFRSGSYFISYRDHAEFRDAISTSLSGVAGAVPMEMEMAGGDGTTTVAVEIVTTNYLSLLGAHPQLGRDFIGDEERPGGPSSVIISSALWRRAFDEDQQVIGRTLTLNGRSFTIVGVAAESFQGRSLVKAADAWLPISAYSLLLPAADAQRLLNRGQTLFGDAIARLRPGVPLAQGQAEANAAMAALPDFANRSKTKGPRSEIGAVLYAGLGHDTFVLERLTTLFRVLMGAVGLLLLLACANAANLLLARSTARRREIAVCQAIGASRSWIVRQQIVEGLTLSIAAGIGGLALAAWLTWLFDGMRIVAFLPAMRGVEIDWRVATFAVSASLLTGLIFATVPAVVSSRVDLLPSLKDGATTTRGGRRLLRASLVAVQITVSVVLMFGAGLFVRTLQNIRGIDLGLQPDAVVSFGIQPSRFGAASERSRVYVESLLERLRQAPGISSAAFTWTTSFSSNRDDGSYARLDAPDAAVSAAETAVSPQFFQTMGIRLLAGRDFTSADKPHDNDTGGVVIVSQSLADKLFPQGGALGSILKVSYPEGGTVEVIGVVADIRGRAVTEDPEPWVYRPAGRPTWGTIQVRSALPAAQVMATIRETARAIDPVIAPHDIEAFGTTVDRAISEQRLFARVSGVFAIVAALLAGIGIYSMMAGAVAERRKEFGIRLALGARAQVVAALVVRSSVTIASIGLVLGLSGAAALGRIVESRLFGVTRFDPASIAAAVAGVLVLTVTASLMPALRATRVDPVRSLRVE
jgi:predicted permease